MAVHRLPGLQGSGKNLTLTGMAAYYCEYFPDIYTYDRVYANYHLIFPGSNYLTNKEMKAFLRKVFAKPEDGGEMDTNKWDNIIILVDEIDGLYPQWTHGEKEARRDLSGVYQDEKMHVQLFCTTHKPDNFNKILRDACEVITIPYYDESSDTLYIEHLDDRFRGDGEMEIHPASVLFDCYDRAERVI